MSIQGKGYSIKCIYKHIRSRELLLVIRYWWWWLCAMGSCSTYVWKECVRVWKVGGLGVVLRRHIACEPLGCIRVVEIKYWLCVMVKGLKARVLKTDHICGVLMDGSCGSNVYDGFVSIFNRDIRRVWLVLTLLFVGIEYVVLYAYR